tara:strand:- start:16430 stop:17980 length:1551 start_codon:yes stop_codon:yes gene_type:complete
MADATQETTETPTPTTTPTPPSEFVLKNILDISDDTILYDSLYDNPISFIKNTAAARATPNVFRTRKKFYGRFIAQLYANGSAGKEGDSMWDGVMAALKRASGESTQKMELFVAVVYVEELQSFSFPKENDFAAIHKIASNGGIFKSYVYSGEIPKYGDNVLVSFNDPASRTEGIFEHPLVGGAAAGAIGPGGGGQRRGGGGGGPRRSYGYCGTANSSNNSTRPTSSSPPVVWGEISSSPAQSTPPEATSSPPEPLVSTSGPEEPTQSTVSGETPGTPPTESRSARRARYSATCAPAGPLSALGRQYGIIDIRGQRTKPHKPRRPWAAIKQVTLHQTGCNMGERPSRYKNINVHFGVTRQGKIIYIEDIPHKQSQAQHFNNYGIGIEFDGHFAGIDGNPRTHWVPSSRHPKTGRRRHISDERKTPMEKSEAQIDAGRKLIDFIIAEVRSNGGKIVWINAHRQTSRSRRSCPGEIIWKGVGVWAQSHHGLSDRGDNYAVNNGKPIPKEWDPKRTTSY